MHRQQWKKALAATIASLSVFGNFATPGAMAQVYDSTLTIPAGLRDVTNSAATPIQYLPFAHFTIPFEVDRSGRAPSEVQLWVSPDEGRSWLKYASSSPDSRAFEFQAAAEGEYLFAVQTRDARGESVSAGSPPMRILIDTTKPQLSVAADVNSAGRLVIDYQIDERYLAEESVRLSYSADGTANWEELRISGLTKEGRGWIGRSEIDMPRCRELEIKLVASDLAQNVAETTSRFNAPRTAAASSGLQLASQRAESKAADGKAGSTKPWDRKPAEQKVLVVGAPATPLPAVQNFPTKPKSPVTTGTTTNVTVPGSQSSQTSSRKVAQSGDVLIASKGAIAWNPTDVPSIGKAASTVNRQSMSIDPPALVSDPSSRAPAIPSPSEELPRPVAVEDLSPNEQSSAISIGQSERSMPHDVRLHSAPSSTSPANSATTGSAATGTWSTNATADQVLDATAGALATPNSLQHAGPEDAYHSRSRSFSLDYSIDSLRGLSVADVELWGTEDAGKTWQKWGSDPDRESPFDVQVASDGLFGFRMVILSANGLVSNRPTDGDPADMWINVDTKLPSVKITRALYGEGAEAGMLVIEYSCNEENLHDRPITFSYSERPNGPWSTIDGGLANTGNYTWKAGSNLPQQVYLRVQAVDRAGNIEEHRLELPINLKGLSPHGRIRGFRPIDPK